MKRRTYGALDAFALDLFDYLDKGYVVAATRKDDGERYIRLYNPSGGDLVDDDEVVALTWSRATP